MTRQFYLMFEKNFPAFYRRSFFQLSIFHLCQQKIRLNDTILWALFLTVMLFVWFKASSILPFLLIDFNFVSKSAKPIMDMGEAYFADFLSSNDK